MKIPTLLSEKIHSGHQLSSFVDSAIAKLEPWISANQLPFFPEYTDHSVKHIEEVMQTALDICTDEATEQMSAKDAALLVLSICLHDCAMHLTEDGFLSLIAPGCPWSGMPEFDPKPWSVLWEDFVGEARRFDGRKLTELFGDSEPVRRPPNSTNDLTKRDRLLIGEFIRRHHARLAHEIAITGIPGIDGTQVPIIDASDETSKLLADLAGLIARSHGLSLRRATDYLDEKYHIRDFTGAHAVFLMVVVRIADYLQIQPKRADKEILKIRKLKSPISQAEWKVHACIQNITRADGDPEAIVIKANPLDVQTFLKVERWLKGLQAELDTSWAVLGEIYGRYHQEKLTNFTIHLRRIRSNLDDTQKFAETVDYVPATIRFDSENPDLLKLLVGPLYSDDPGVGLRELIQNAVDAVREFDDIAAHEPQLKDIDRREQDADVVLSIEHDSDGRPLSVTVSDRGTGMNLDIIMNYFLKAGASFRKSDAWRRHFEDERGHSRIARSGRFGVGALAAFLLGNEIEVITRHYESSPNQGLCFSAGLDSLMLSVTWVKCPVGTSIKIKIPPHRREHVSKELHLERYVDSENAKVGFFDRIGYYFATYPVLKRLLEPGRRSLEARNALPSEDGPTASGWRRFSTDEYPAIFWSYNQTLPTLSCNGIVIDKSAHIYRSDVDAHKIFSDDFLAVPRLHVYDHDGRLPLNLQRTGLSASAVSFADALVESVTDELIAYGLLHGPQGLPSNVRERSWFWGEHPALGREDSYRRDNKPYQGWFITKDGFGLVDPHLIHARGTKAILMSFAQKAAEGPKIFMGRGREAFLSTDLIFLANDIDSVNFVYGRQDLLRKVVEFSQTSRSYSPFPRPLRRVSCAGHRVYIRSDIVDNELNRKIGSHLPKFVTDTLRRSGKEVALGDGWIVLEAGKCPSKPIFNLEQYLDENKGDCGSVAALAECYVSESWKPDQAQMRVVAKRWFSLLDAAIIPFNMEERRKRFSSTYKQLQAVISEIENGHRLGPK